MPTWSLGPAAMIGLGLRRGVRRGGRSSMVRRSAQTAGIHPTNADADQRPMHVIEIFLRIDQTILHSEIEKESDYLVEGLAMSEQGGPQVTNEMLGVLVAPLVRIVAAGALVHAVMTPGEKLHHKVLPKLGESGDAGTEDVFQQPLRTRG